MRWLKDIQVGLVLLWGYARLPSRRPIPELHLAVRHYAQTSMRAIAELPLESRGKWAYRLCWLLYVEGWRATALEVAKTFGDALSAVDLALFYWNGGDHQSAVDLLIQQNADLSKLPAWATMAVGWYFMSECEVGFLSKMTLPETTRRVLEEISQVPPSFCPERVEAVLQEARNAGPEIQEWVADLLLVWGALNHLSPQQLGAGHRAVWHLLCGELQDAHRWAIRALRKDKACMLSRLVLAVTLRARQPSKSRRVVERLLYPELTHGVVNTESRIGRLIAKCLTGHQVTNEEMEESIKMCEFLHDAVLLVFVMYGAHVLGNNAAVSLACNTLKQWQACEFPILQAWGLIC